jgi:hypothetical protein
MFQGGLNDGVAFPEHFDVVPKAVALEFRKPSTKPAWYDFYYNPTVGIIYVYQDHELSGMVAGSKMDMTDGQVKEMVRDYCGERSIMQYNVYRCIYEQEW